VVKKIRIRASRIRNDKVFTKDKQKLGTLVNVFFDKEPGSYEANLVVFPDGPGWVETELGPLLAGEAIELIKGLMPEEAAQIGKDVSEKGYDVAKNIWLKNLKKREQEALQKFYYIPLSKILEFEDGRNKLIFKQDRVILKLTKGAEDGDAYSDPAGLLAETEIPFYRQGRTGSREETEPLWSIQLEQPMCYHRFRVKDSNGVRGRIDDIVLDSSQGIVTDLVVNTIGPNAGEYIVSVDDFDFDTMTYKKSFHK
jgi:sporulation protein YlmC with PRC-barrel domain